MSRLVETIAVPALGLAVACGSPNKATVQAPDPDLVTMPASFESWTHGCSAATIMMLASQDVRDCVRNVDAVTLAEGEEGRSLQGECPTADGKEWGVTVTLDERGFPELSADLTDGDNVLGRFAMEDYGTAISYTYAPEKEGNLATLEIHGRHVFDREEGGRVTVNWMTGQDTENINNCKTSPVLHGALQELDWWLGSAGFTIREANKAAEEAAKAE